MPSDAIAYLFRRLFGTPPEDITDSSRRGDLEGWDSLGHLILIAALRNEFSVDIPPEMALEIETVADVRRIVSARRNGGCQ
jgi:acyl carrier protein